MKNTIKLFGTQSRWLCAISLALVMGLSMAACGGDGDGDGGSSNNGSLNGIWKGNESGITLTISGSSFTFERNGSPLHKGTVSYKDSTFTLEITHAYINGWFAVSETITGTYTLSGDTLTLSGLKGSTGGGYNMKYTKSS